MQTIFWVFILLIFVFGFCILFNKVINPIIKSYDTEIPKIIIQTWKTKSIPEKYEKLVKSIKSFNPEPKFKYLFFDDNDIEVFLKTEYPLYYKTYQKLPVVIQKIDFFRYVAVYHYGGFYFDLDMEGLAPLNTKLLKHDCVFPVDEIIEKQHCEISRYKKYCEQNFYKLIGQYAFGAKPKNEFVKQLIDNIHNNIDKLIKDYENLKNKKDLDYVYSSTGPDYVTDIYLNYRDKYEIKVLNCGKRQYFGNYAAHRYYGTWK
jgi:mannosyltransferase OCH1-like enzyme